jgi:hypothetical protein
MSQYARTIKSAQRLIAKYGQDVIWRKPNVSVPDPTKPWKSLDNAPTDIPVKIVFVRPEGGLSNALYHLIKGTDAVTGAPKGLMAPINGFNPEITDRVIRNGSTLVIGSINVVAPASDAVLYIIEFA